jgi:hypothetical protein
LKYLLLWIFLLLVDGAVFWLPAAMPLIYSVLQVL